MWIWIKTRYTEDRSHAIAGSQIQYRKKKKIHNHMCSVCFLTQEETGGKKICFGYSLMLVGPVAG